MLKYKYIALILISGILSRCYPSIEKEPPNVVLILIDDMGYGDIGTHGNPVLKTPGFDQLHEESARFTNFAVSPTCAPTRAALMTGTHEFLVGVTHTRSPMNYMDTEVVTLAEVFKNSGYRTGLFGKWHLGQTDQHGPWSRGFDETLTVPGDRQDSHFNPVLLHNQVEKQLKGYREDILFEEAMHFIEENKDSAFFCYIPTYSPHSPNKAPEKYIKPYQGYVNPERPDGVYSAGFFGQVANVDENLVRLRDFMDSLELAENTLLIVMNDNGGTRGVDTYNSGMRGLKTTPWRGGTRAYSFWKWGDHFPAGDRSLMSGHIDVFPTLVNVCELNVPPELEDQLDGSSLKPVLMNPAAKLGDDRMQITHIGRWESPEIWSDHKYAGCSVRWKNYTLVRHEPCNNKQCRTCKTARRRANGARPLYTGNSEHYILTSPGEWELYNIDIDPHQDHNIAKTHPEIVAKMSAFYDHWWTRVETRLNRSFDPAKENENPLE